LNVAVAVLLHTPDPRRGLDTPNYQILENTLTCDIVMAVNAKGLGTVQSTL